MIVPSPKPGLDLLRLYVDGGSRGNPGPAAGGVVIADEQGTPLVERGFFVGHVTGNVAEYHALVRGLELAAQFAPRRLEIFADSELIVRQVTGQYRVKSPDLKPLHERVQVALLKFDSWQIRHIPRSQNQRADRLANLAMNRKGDVEDAGDDMPSVAVARDEADDDVGGPAVLARVVLGCDPRICPAVMMVGEEFRFTAVTPPGLCVYAAGAVLPAAIGLLNEANVMDRPPTGNAEPVRVSCPRPGCHAAFELSLDLAD